MVREAVEMRGFNLSVLTDKWIGSKQCCSETCCSALSVCRTGRQQRRQMEGVAAWIYCCWPWSGDSSERAGDLRPGCSPNGAHLWCLMLPFNPSEPHNQLAAGSPSWPSLKQFSTSVWIRDLGCKGRLVTTGTAGWNVLSLHVCVCVCVV